MRLLVLALGFALWALTAAAQQTPDYEAWTARAAVAEEVLEQARASDEALDSLRLEIVGWRSQFLEALDANSARITALQSQIAALGPVPENGEEDPEIAERRAALNDLLAEARAPVLRAEEAYTRSDGIVRGIDSLIRTRQAEAFFELGPSPLNPANWPGAARDLTASLGHFWDEIQRNAQSPGLRSAAIERIPVILMYLLLGIVLIWRGGTWARKAVTHMRSVTRRGTGVWGFVLSLGQIVLPLVGLWALTQAALATGYIGVRWALLVEQLPIWAGTLLGIRWLADQGFAEDEDEPILPLSAEDRRRAGRAAKGLALLYVLSDVLGSLTQFDSYSPETVAVLGFPLLLLSGLLLARMGAVRNDAPIVGSVEAVEDDGPFKMRLARLLGRAALIIGIVGPALAAVGFVKAGEGLVYPAIATLALIGLVLVLQRFVNDVYDLFVTRDAEEEGGLIPALAGFAIVLAAMPPLALIWGARVADLTELWVRFREGFQFGQTRIAPTDFLVVLLVFVIGYMLTRLLQGGMRSSVLPKTRIDSGGQDAIVSGIGYIGIVLSAIIAISSGGLDLSSVALVAGALSVGIGFGLQTIVQNFVSGIILLVERPISQGDWIEIGGTHGIVKEISVRATRIETFDRFDVIVPNGDLVSAQVRNYTRGNNLGRVIVPVGVAYGTDTRMVEKVLLDIARQHEMVLMNPEPYVYFAGFGADSMDFEIRAILRDVTKTLSVRTEMNHQIAERFAEKGVEIPFAQRDVWLRNPEVLADAVGTGEKT